jgi:hypothetical protein
MCIFFLTAAQPSPEDLLIHATAIKNAMQRTFGSVDAACKKMGVDRGNFEKECSGERHLRYGPLIALGPKFCGWLLVFLATEIDLPEELQAADRLQATSRRMAHMELPMDASALARRTA